MPDGNRDIPVTNRLVEPPPGSSDKERTAQAAKIRWAMCALHIESTSVAGQHLEDVIRWLEKGKAPEPRAGRDIEEKAREWFEQEFGRWFPRHESGWTYHPPTPQAIGRAGFKAGHRACAEKLAEAVRLLRLWHPRCPLTNRQICETDRFLAQFQEGNPDADV